MSSIPKTPIDRSPSEGVQAPRTQHQHEGSLDPINLPRDLTDAIYLYDPTSALGLEPSRRSAIVRLITGWSPSEDRSSAILEALGREDHSLLADTPELFPYLRSHFREDESIWIAILLQKVSLVALNELIALGVIELAQSGESEEGGSITESFPSYLYNYIRRICIKGELEVVQALGLFDYIISDRGDGITTALLSTESSAVARELLDRTEREGWDMRTIFEDITGVIDLPNDSGSTGDHRELERRFPLLVEMIERSASDIDTADYRFQEFMELGISYECFPIIRYLRDRYRVPINSYTDELPFDPMLEALRNDPEINTIGSLLRETAIHNLPYHDDPRKIEALLEHLRVPPFWPDESYVDDDASAYSFYRTRGKVRKLLSEKRTTLLNRYRPHMLESILLRSEANPSIPEEDIPGETMEYIDGDNELLPAIRVALLRGLRCEESHPWIRR